MKHVIFKLFKGAGHGQSSRPRIEMSLGDEPPGSLEVQSFSAPANPVLTFWETTCS